MLHCDVLFSVIGRRFIKLTALTTLVPDPMSDTRKTRVPDGHFALAVVWEFS